MALPLEQPGSSSASQVAYCYNTKRRARLRLPRPDSSEVITFNDNGTLALALQSACLYINKQVGVSVRIKCS